MTTAVAGYGGEDGQLRPTTGSRDALQQGSNFGMHRRQVGDRAAGCVASKQGGRCPAQQASFGFMGERNDLSCDNADVKQNTVAAKRIVEPGSGIGRRQSPGAISSAGQRLDRLLINLFAHDRVSMARSSASSKASISATVL